MSDWSTYVQQWLQQQQTPTAQAGGVNRSGPATPPPIPVPANQNPMPGGYMQQAFSLSGVPTAGPQAGAAPPAGTTPPTGTAPPNGQLPAEYQGWLNALLGGGGFGQLNTMGMPPQVMQYLQSLSGRP